MEKQLDVLTSWIENDETFLDPSQSLAIKHALENRISIIQGPPGTGKTFTGTVLTNLLSTHPSLKNKPIVCITYTNHALDQFLEVLIDKFPNLVRIGSRSKSENDLLLKRNISSLRRQYVGYSYEKQQCLEIEQKMKKITAKLASIRYSMQHQIELIYNLCVKYCQAFIRKIRSQFPSQYYMSRDLQNKTTQSMFEDWYFGRDIERATYFKQNSRRKQLTRTENTFDVLREMDSDSHTDEISAEDQSEVLPDQNTVKQNPQDIEQDDDSSVHENEDLEQEIEAETLEEELNEMIEYEVWKEIVESSSTVKTHHYAMESTSDFIQEITLLEEYFSIFPNIYEIKVKYRTKAFKQLLSFVEKRLKDNFLRLVDKRSKLESKLQEQRTELDFLILERNRANLIGLSSTAASMHRQLLTRLKAPVYIIEEAAELLESQISSILHPHIEHLILIGDEKQLRPKVNSYHLERNCNFSISLFERLIMNGLNHQALTIQQRMRPEIRKLVDPFYTKLTDHEKVTRYENVNGVGLNVCFVQHDHEESQSEDIQSKTNEFEAEFICKMTKYIINVNQYGPSNITILTPYKGQLLLIKSKLRRLLPVEKSQKIRVSTVDDFQGEENDVTLLSLVRSNNNNSLGFVSIRNRIIVALSRARKGLYILGNQDLLSNNSDWFNILQRLQEFKMVHDHLPLFCPQHPHKKECIRKPSDFDGVIWGGCRDPCSYTFACGHVCPLTCHHPALHQDVKCEKICNSKIQTCGHRCKAKCHHPQTCPKCETKIEHAYQDCGHIAQIPCHSQLNPRPCPHICGKFLKCGHSCKNQCGICKIQGGCSNHCEENMEGFCESCQKNYKRKCSSPDMCTNKCPSILGCGHQCSGTCGDCAIQGKHQDCAFECSKYLICGHKCVKKHKCHLPCSKCEQNCEVICFHGRNCTLKCFDRCIKCKEPCPIKCPHRACTNLCHERCNVDPCNEPCSKVCPKCNQKCVGLCGEPCPPCMFCEQKEGICDWQCSISFQKFEDMDLSTDRVYYLPECGHKFLLESMDQYIQSQTEDLDGEGFYVKYISCPNCKTAIFTAPRYQRQIKSCLERMDNLKHKLLEKEREEEANRLSAIRVISETVNYAQGHWFACKNGHPYFIGECGGAMQEGTCVDCGAPIGGRNHQVTEGNSLATEIDGATAPAWPTALHR
nr:unnamed protein product [Naegleria fowleri]